jgi:glutamyl-tRNA reductase
MSWVLEHLQIIHAPKGATSTPITHLPSFSLFETCMRRIFIRFSHLTPELSAPNSTLFTGELAYQFLLQVICGLHSQVVGETEVLGQFKVFLKNQTEMTPQSSQWSALSQMLLTDCKEVRDKNLKSLGGNSYGSVLRKHLRQCTELEIWGAGALVQEILPWIAKDNRSVCIRSRNKQRSQEQFHELSENLSFVEWNHELSATLQAIVIAAPLSNAQILAMIPEGLASRVIVFDMRDKESEKLFLKGYNLAELCETLELDTQKIQQAKTLSINHIFEKSKMRFNSTQNRPYGWEDFCS